MAEHAEGSTEVFASPAEVMAVVAGFEAYPEWVAGLEEVEVLAHDRRGRGTRVAFRLRTPWVSRPTPSPTATSPGTPGCPGPMSRGRWRTCRAPTPWNRPPTAPPGSPTGSRSPSACPCPDWPSGR